MKLPVSVLLLIMALFATAHAQTPQQEKTVKDIVDGALKDSAAKEKERRAKLPPAERHFWAGLDQYRAGKHALALTEFNRAVALKPEHSSALIYRGMTLLALRRPAEALTSLDRGLAAPELKKDENRRWLQQTRYYRAVALLATDRADEAIAEAGRSLILGPSASVYLIRAEAYTHRARTANAPEQQTQAAEDLRSAHADLAQALKLDASAAPVWNAKAKVHFLLKEEDLACQAVATACRLGDCRLAREFTECKP